MIYRIEKEDFRLDLELNKWYENDPEDAYMNAELTIRVVCEGFSGYTMIDFDTGDFEIFLDELQKLQETLAGKAELKEPYNSESFLEFEGDGRGHIHISGSITSRNGDWMQELNFENEIDQTFLPMQQVYDL